MASKIESELTPAEVVDLLETLVETDGGTKLRVIQELAKERGVEISLMSASSFRDGALNPYLEKIKSRKQKALMLAGALEGEEEGGENPFLKGARLELAEQIFDFLGENEVQPKQFAGLTKALSGLTGSEAQAALTNARLKEYEAKEEERAEKREELERKKANLKAKGGFTEETLQMVEEAIGLL